MGQYMALRVNEEKIMQLITRGVQWQTLEAISTLCSCRGQKYLTRKNKKAYTVFGGLAYKSNFKLGIAVLQQKSGVVNMTDEEQER